MQENASYKGTECEKETQELGRNQNSPGSGKALGPGEREVSTALLAASRCNLHPKGSHTRPWHHLPLHATGKMPYRNCLFSLNVCFGTQIQ